MLRIARLAVAAQAQGLEIGKALLRFALDLARRTADEIRCVGVVVDAKPESQAAYLRYGFESFAALEGALPEPTPMFFPCPRFLPRGLIDAGFRVSTTLAGHRPGSLRRGITVISV